MRNYLTAATIAAGTLLLPAAASAGQFGIVLTDTGEEALEYTGTVEMFDNEVLKDAVEHSGIDLVLINSPGGSAYGGVLLNRMARELGIRTMAGADFGAWSAGAVFWVGGSQEHESPTAEVGFHYAYNPFNDLQKTDTINSVMAVAMRSSGWNETMVENLLDRMDYVRRRWSWSGFVVFSPEAGVTMIDVNAAPEGEEDTRGSIISEAIDMAAARDLKGGL